jgi:hypothetical protein
MKKVAVILFIIFSLVQAGPSLLILVNADQVSLFIVDEEKNDTKEEEPNSFKTLCSANNFSILLITAKGLNHFIEGEKLYISPYLDNLTPPPNFC